MVTFTCNACGDSVKKDKVDTHYRSKCPACDMLSCIDCGKDFWGDSYKEHTSCISEAEKYQGHLYQPKENSNKGQVKQDDWIKALSTAAAQITDPKMLAAFQRMQSYSNIPRKEKKFINFAKNSIGIYNEVFLKTLWGYFSAAIPKKEPQAAGGNQAGSGATASKDAGKEGKEAGAGAGASAADAPKKDKETGDKKDKKKKKKRKAEAMEDGDSKDAEKKSKKKKAKGGSEEEKKKKSKKEKKKKKKEKREE